jgi:hypothetical protein
MIHHPRVFSVRVGKDPMPFSNDMVHEIPNISGMNQQKHIRNRQNNGEFLVSLHVLLHSWRCLDVILPVIALDTESHHCTVLLLASSLINTSVLQLLHIYIA